MNIFSFCLNSFYHSNNLIDHQLLTEFSNKYGSSILFTPLRNQKSTSLNVLLSGQTDTIKGELLRNNPVKSILSINSPNIDALFHTEIKTSLAKIAQVNNIEIEVHASSEPEIRMFGPVGAIEHARVQILVVLDQLSGLLVDTLDDIPVHLHNLISGRKHAQLQSIMEETCTNIYLQSPFSNICRVTDSDKMANKIYLTGDSTTSISRAKELLCKLSAQKSKSMYHKDSVMDLRKIDWILLNKRTELRKIMNDNGSYFMFPTLGSGGNSVSIYAENRINVERSIRLLNYLISNIYEATFEFTKSDVSLIDRVFGGASEKFAAIISDLSQSSGVDILFEGESSRLELFGTEMQVRNTYQLLCNMVFFKENHQFTSFALELATDQREFISGKKNGKINKIMKSCAVTIRFTVSNEYNSSIIVESNNYMKALDGLTMLQDELPAETSFYVPEIYHRRIIGVAGKNIQKVMKKYGVYVKFSGTEEFASMGGYFENEDNVVARTPMKNQINLENLRHSVTEFISFQKDKNYTFTTVCVPYQLHRTIPSQYGSQLREICRTNNAKIWWPERLGSNHVTIYGPQSQLSTVAMFMEQLISTEKHIAVKIIDERMENVLLEKSTVSSLQQKIKSTVNIKLIVQHLSQVSAEQSGNNKLQWISPYSATNLILYRLIYRHGQTKNSKKAKDLIRSFIESKEFAFEGVAEMKLIRAYTPSQSSDDAISINNNNTFINTDLLTIISSPPLPVVANATQPEFNNYDTKLSDGLAMFDNMPSPPLSEPQHLQHHPHDKTGISCSLLSAPQPTGRNIWASPRIPSNNVIPPRVVQMENMHIDYQVPTPPSPPYHLTHSNAFTMNQQAHDVKVTPSFSAPIIGSSTNRHTQHHKSWPDAFFGSRDLFDTLPIRRASASTQSAFEFIPNSTSTVDYGHKGLVANKYQNKFNQISHQSPFIYASAPINGHSQTSRHKGFNM